MAEEVPRYGCYCCRPQCDAEPTWELDPCGYAFDETKFDVSVRPDIPASAYTMRWLDLSGPMVLNGNDRIEVIATPGQVIYDITWTDTKATYFYDPSDGGCVLDKRIQGSAVDYAVNDLGERSIWSGPAVFRPTGSNDPVIYFTGTDFNGDPITPFYDSIPTEVSGIPPAEENKVFSLSTDGLVVEQIQSRNWSYDDGIDKRSGFDNQLTGYTEPFFRCKVTIPDLPTINFMEVEWICLFTPDSGAPYDLSLRRFTWRNGDDREVTQIEEYTDFGTITLKGMRWRCSPNGFWQSAPSDFTIEPWPDVALGLDGSELNDNGLYLTYNE